MFMFAHPFVLVFGAYPGGEILLSQPVNYIGGEYERGERGSFPAPERGQKKSARPCVAGREVRVAKGYSYPVDVAIETKNARLVSSSRATELNRGRVNIRSELDKY